MYLFTLDCSNSFMEAISVLCRFSESSHMMISPDMASLTVYHHSLDLTVAFQMLPPFFTRFFSHKTHYTKIFLVPFFHLLQSMRQSNFSSIALYVPQPYHRLSLQFRNPCDKEERTFLNRQLRMSFMDLEDAGQIDMGAFFSLRSQEFKSILTEFNGYSITRLGEERRHSVGTLPTLIPSRGVDAGEIDYTSFVSIDLEIFTWIVKELGGARANVTLTSSLIMFSVPNKNVTLSKEKKQCIIGGVGIAEEIQFTITFNLPNFFSNLRSKWLWLFKPVGSNGIILTSYITMFAQISAYFP